MTNRERMKAVLNYQPYDRMPVVHFGYWNETLDKWVAEGHLKQEEVEGWGDNNASDKLIAKKLGFDCNWSSASGVDIGQLMDPLFETKVVKDFGDGTIHWQNAFGVILLAKKDAGSIPSEIAHTLVDRASWEKEYLPRLQFSRDKIDLESFKKVDQEEADTLIGIHCGSYYGTLRDIAGIVGLSYIYADDEELYDEMINTLCDLQYQAAKVILEESNVKFDFAHFWEDICFKNGPLISPAVFREKIGPHYKKITDLLHVHGINIVSLDCDGLIDSLLPIWLENGINTMFPIEVGTWEASISPWREKYGKSLLGVGGMNKVVFAEDYAAIDKEVERLKPLIELGGFIPCPDHRIAPDAKWENIQYYTEKMRNLK